MANPIDFLMIIPYVTDLASTYEGKEKIRHIVFKAFMYDVNDEMVVMGFEGMTISEFAEVLPHRVLAGSRRAFKTKTTLWILGRMS